MQPYKITRITTKIQNMKSLVIIFIVAMMGLVGCNNTAKKGNKILASKTDQVSGHDDTNRSVSRQPNLATILYNDPSLFGGCSFGNAFSSFLRVQDYESCLKYTSTGTIHKYGAAAVLELYKSLKINYNLHLLSVIREKDTMVMRYKANEMATSRFKQFVVVIENDTCKLALISPLNSFLK